jgi:hypothetical protein
VLIAHELQREGHAVRAALRWGLGTRAYARIGLLPIISQQESVTGKTAWLSFYVVSSSQT